MFSIKVDDIVKATRGVLLNSNCTQEIKNICTDSRKIRKGDLFVPLLGDNFDGHDYIQKAMEAGASGYLTSRQAQLPIEGMVIKVEDTLKAFQDIGRFNRDKYNIPIIAVTGSAGKTSTKDMIYEVLSTKYKVLKTEGNLNNHIGLPMTLLNLSAVYEAAVVEIGMNEIGEISLLSKIAKPDISVITNIGMAHIGKLGSRQNILKAKMEIIDGMKSSGVLILNGDDGLLHGLENLLELKTVFYGLEEGLDIRGYNVITMDELSSAFNLQVGNKEYTITIPIPGKYNVYNALAAIAVGLELKIPADDIISGLKNYKPDKMRMNVIKLKEDISLIDDAYNANPNSMEEALRILKDLSGARKIAVLGDMLELGDWAHQAHKDIGIRAVKSGVNYLIALGGYSKYTAEGAAQAGMSSERIITCETIQEVNAVLKNLIKRGDTILVKGSRGMKMEGIIDYIRREV